MVKRNLEDYRSSFSFLAISQLSLICDSLLLVMQNNNYVANCHLCFKRGQCLCNGKCLQYACDRLKWCTENAYRKGSYITEEPMFFRTHCSSIWCRKYPEKFWEVFAHLRCLFYFCFYSTHPPYRHSADYAKNNIQYKLIIELKHLKF